MPTATTDLDARAVAAEVRAQMGRTRTSTADLARAAGLRRQTLSERLNDHSPFTLTELTAVAKALGTTAGVLMRRAEEAKEGATK